MIEKKSNFKGKFGPLEDEITINRYYEKYKDIEVIKGAFKKVFNIKFSVN